MNINLKTAFVMSNLVLPLMKQQKYGKIINLSSQAAHDGGGKGAAAYAASKGAAWTFTKSLAKEVRDQMPIKILLGRNGTSADVAKVILFLASELSDYITGQSIEVNGGLYMP